MRSERERLSAGDEIDLFELVEGLWKQRLLIVVVMIVVIGLALAYALRATPVYEARVIVQPPAQNDISPLNYGRGGDSGLNMLTVKEVYGVYLHHLQSESLRREFFQGVYLPSLSPGERKGSQDELYARFEGLLTLGGLSKDALPRFFVKVDLPDPRLAADWAVRYIEMAGQLGTHEITEDLKAEAAMKSSNLEREIAAARDEARKQREDRIIQLTEALRIARSIGLERPPIISNALSGEFSANMKDSLTYMRGSKALLAEIENLRDRVSDDPFVPGLRQRQQFLDFYRSVHVDTDRVRVYRQDGPVESPDRAVKPRKGVIVAFGVVAGIALGVMLALLRNLRGLRRR
ncbi:MULTISPECIES: LPS O-antigen chain length determinant protein WzzB [Pseudomonas]|uniref:LPS O-antigen chain length determinant protein WzzB n=1 Tax=Pseudomonas TaxID=286 RepID=UPI001F0161C1|nr:MULTISPECIES: Wzz/FepE/Etk N-terminal domain-containing protein [Pseudomonas]MCG8295037.1 Wzz/FepE/Etk N-terminal domain-containing protein [Pseudomonas entomophila]